MKIITCILMAAVIALGGCSGKNPLVRNDVERQCVEIGKEKACGVVAVKGLLGQFMKIVNDRTEAERIPVHDNRIIRNLVIKANNAVDAYASGAGTWESVGNVVDELSKELARMSQLDY